MIPSRLSLLSTRVASMQDTETCLNGCIKLTMCMSQGNKTYQGIKIFEISMSLTRAMILVINTSKQTGRAYCTHKKNTLHMHYNTATILCTKHLILV